MKGGNVGTSANMWLVDSTGKQINGDSDISSRKRSIDLRSIEHNVHSPYDPQTGKNTSRRIHAPFTIIKNIDSVTPIFNKACCNGEQLKEAMIALYRINQNGSEEQYFRYYFNEIKVVNVAPMIHCSMGEADCESVSFIYGNIKWEYIEDNIAHEDSWLLRA
jgi:type VI secretion system secreted protein Hcp